MRSSRLVLVVLSLLTSLPMLTGATSGGCDGPGLIGTDTDSGRVKVLITDKPFPFEYLEQALVTITRVELRPAGDDGQDDDAGGYVTVFDDPAGRSFNLLELQNGRVDVLADTDVPAGLYSQLRLVVTQGEVRLRDGRVFTLRVPSGEQTGIKLHGEFEVQAGEETALLLDVDLSRAFKPVPGGEVKHPAEIREFHFSPSLAIRLVSIAETGGVSGIVQDVNGFPIPAVAVTAMANEQEVTSSASEEDGTFKLIGLPAGTYRLEFSADGYLDAQVESAMVVAGQVTAVGAVILEPAQSGSPAAAGAPVVTSPAHVNHALNAPVTLHGTFFSTQYYTGTASDPQTVVDGVFVPRRTTWDRGTVWWVMIGGFIRGQYLTIDLGGPKTIDSFVVQVNSREAYALSCWDLNTQDWQVVWSIPKGDAFAFGMESRPDVHDSSVRFALPSPMVTDRIMFSGAAINGTHLYSVSEIQAFGPAANSPPVASAGGPYAAPATSWAGAEVALDGSASYDPDGDPLVYSWRAGEFEIGTAQQVLWKFPPGETEVTLTVTDPAGLSTTASSSVTVSASEVHVDIRPGEEPNSVNLKSKGVLPVAFLTDEAFDAASIDPATVSFPGYPFAGFVRMQGKGKLKPQAHLEDVDADGDLDLVVHLETSLLPLPASVTTCTMGALTWDGHLVRGDDEVRMVGQ